MAEQQPKLEIIVFQPAQKRAPTHSLKVLSDNLNIKHSLFIQLLCFFHSLPRHPQQQHCIVPQTHRIAFIISQKKGFFPCRKSTFNPLGMCVWKAEAFWRNIWREVETTSTVMSCWVWAALNEQHVKCFFCQHRQQSTYSRCRRMWGEGAIPDLPYFALWIFILSSARQLATHNNNRKMNDKTRNRQNV